MSRIVFTPEDTGSKRYMRLSAHKLKRLFGSIEAFGEALRERYPAIESDADMQAVLDDPELALVDDHPWVSLKEALVVDDFRMSAREIAAVAGAVQGTATSEAGQQEVDVHRPMLARGIVDAGGDWTLFYARLPVTDVAKWPGWKDLSFESRLGLVGRLPMMDAQALEECFEHEVVTAQMLGNSKSASKSTSTPSEPTDAPTAP